MAAMTVITSAINALIAPQKRLVSYHLIDAPGLASCVGILIPHSFRMFETGSRETSTERTNERSRDHIYTRMTQLTL